MLVVLWKNLELVGLSAIAAFKLLARWVFSTYDGIFAVFRKDFVRGKMINLVVTPKQSLWLWLKLCWFRLISQPFQHVSTLPSNGALMVAAIEQSEVRFADNLFERFARVAKANVNKAMQETCWYTWEMMPATVYREWIQHSSEVWAQTVRVGSFKLLSCCSCFLKKCSEIPVFFPQITLAQDLNPSPKIDHHELDWAAGIHGVRLSECLAASWAVHILGGWRFIHHRPGTIDPPWSANYSRTWQASTGIHGMQTLKKSDVDQKEWRHS